MKVLLLSSSLEGGAGGAAYRLHQGIQCSGFTSQILVVKKDVNDPTVIVTPRNKVGKLGTQLCSLTGVGKLDKLPLKFYPQRDGRLFSLQWLGDSIRTKVRQLSPDVINLHWVCSEWMRIETLSKLNRPVVWTLHDMWPFTGGCHYSEKCSRYTASCGACPQLCSTSNWDLSRWVWSRKAKAWKNLNITVVAPSSWLAECARSSSLFKNLRVEMIPNGIDTKTFKPIHRLAAREILDLPKDKQIVLFGAWNNDPRKGFNLLLQAFESFRNTGLLEKMHLLVFGFHQPNNLPDLGISSQYLGRLSDDILSAVVYSAADVFVAPSLSEAFGLTITESLSCGTPVVAFDTTGQKDIVEHKRNGYLARPFEVEDLARGIAWILEDSQRRKCLAQRAREKATQEYSIDLQAQRYRALFNELVEKHKRPIHTNMS